MDYISIVYRLRFTEFGDYSEPEFAEMCSVLWKYGDRHTLDISLCKACEYNTPVYAKILLDKGADPNTQSGQPGFVAAEHGYLDTLKLLRTRGAKLEARFFNAASYWGYNDVAYWLYLHGVRGYETVEFEIYKAAREAERHAAARKIYFWVFPKLYRNPEFAMRQASKSYDDLFNSVDCSA